MPRMNTKISFCILIGLLGSFGSSAIKAQDAKQAGSGEIRLAAPANWRKERIKLPPSFARDMKLKGVEEVRFTPGMFDAKSDSFLSYLLVFRVESDPKLTKDVLHRELLAYYRGLSVSVSKGRGVEVEPEKFSIKLTESQGSKHSQHLAGRLSFNGELKWLEPFVTRKSQTLQLELESWQDDDAKQNYLFLLISPKKRSEPVWTEMRQVRAGYLKEQKGRSR